MPSDDVPEEVLCISDKFPPNPAAVGPEDEKPVDDGSVSRLPWIMMVHSVPFRADDLLWANPERRGHDILCECCARWLRCLIGKEGKVAASWMRDKTSC